MIPKVGDVYDYYTYCIQLVLSNKETETPDSKTLSIKLKRFSDTHRNVQIGVLSTFNARSSRLHVFFCGG